MVEIQKINFQLCEETDPEKISSLKDKIAETKLDGNRCALIKEGSNITIWGRGTRGIRTDNFPEIVEAAKLISGNFILDGELCVFDKQGKSIFPDVNARSHLKDKFKIKLMQQMKPATFMAFDILKFNGQDIQNKELQERKAILDNCLSNLTGPIKANKVWADIDAAWKDANAKQLEGIVIKDIHSKYIGKRSNDWQKCKRKELTKIRMTSYEIHNMGITLSNGLIRCTCNGIKHKEVKELIDRQGYADIIVRHMSGKTENNLMREPVFYELDKGEKNGMDAEAIRREIGLELRSNNPERKEQQTDKPIQPVVKEAVKSKQLSLPTGNTERKKDNNNSLARFGF
jgi:DNA ligase-1